MKRFIVPVLVLASFIITKSVFAQEGPAADGRAETETLFTSNVGGGVKWYAGRGGLRADYRFIAVPSKDEAVSNGAVLINVGR